MNGPRQSRKALPAQRLALALAGCIVAASAAAPGAQAQSYPTRPIRIILPFPPGGGFDGIARPFSESLAAILGQPVVIDHRPGAGGNIGAEAAARSAPDGYTLLFANPFLATNPAMVKALPYDPLKDFVAITKVGMVNTALAVHWAVPAKDLKELIALSKRKPLNFGTPGIGSMPHLVGELLNLDGTMRLVHVPYKGSGPAITDAIGGQIEIVITPLSNIAQHIRAGKLRGIAVLSTERAAIMPELPTFAESGVPVQADTWYGVFAPAGTPEAVLKRVHEASVQALAQPEIVERLRRSGYEPGSSSPEALAAQLKADVAKWNRVVADAKIPRE
jgi:tripartite-type tricarboxylate transporter receptor subunit TctC